MAKIASRKIKAESGNEYDFNVYPYPTNFKSLAGVYVVSKRYKDGAIFRHTNLYVGITDDMKERHDNHERQEDFEAADANSISFHREDSKEAREKIEEDLLANGKKWPLNRQRS